MAAHARYRGPPPGQIEAFAMIQHSQDTHWITAFAPGQSCSVQVSAFAADGQFRTFELFTSLI